MNQYQRIKIKRNSNNTILTQIKAYDNATKAVGLQ